MSGIEPPWRRYLPWGIAAVVVAILVIGGVTLFGGDDDAVRTATTVAQGTSTTVAPTTTTPVDETTTTEVLTTTTTEAPTTTTTVPLAGGSWTVLVYMLADNNLEPVLAWDFEEMAALPEADDLNVVVLADRHAEFTERAILNLPDWETAKLIQIAPDELKELDDWGEIDMGDPDMLTDFMVEGMTAYPADHYALVMWNHGAPEGIGSDDSSGDILGTWEIEPAVRAALDRTGVDHLDIIGFDACLMAALDVAVAVAPVADYMVASEELEPGTGWDYSAFAYVADYPAGTADGLGRNILETFVSSVGESEPNVTLSLIDLELIDELTAALDTLADVMADDADSFAAAVGRERAKVVEFGSSPNPEDDFFMIDLGDLLERIADAEPGLTTPARAALRALDDAIVDSQNGPATAGATGLAVYFPPYPEHFWGGYRDFAAPEWMGFLDAYYAAGEAIPEIEQPSFVPVGNEAEWGFDEDGLWVLADFGIAAEANAVEATLYSGVIEDDGSITFYGEDQGFIEGSSALAGYDLTVLTLFDGEDRAIAYQDISVNDDVTVLTLEIPVAYYPPDSDEWQDALISLVYDSTTEEFTETVYLYDDGGTIGVFEPPANGIFIPWILRQYEDGTVQWEQTSDIGLWSDMPYLLYEWKTIEAGTAMYAELWVCDFGGNCDFAAVETVAPGDGPDPVEGLCINEEQGYGVAVPDGWYVWDDPDDLADCSYIDANPLAGMSASEAFDAAAITVEMLEAGPAANIANYLGGFTVPEDVTVIGLPASRYLSDDFTGYVVPLGDGWSLVIVGWEYLHDGVGALVDTLVTTLMVE